MHTCYTLSAREIAYSAIGKGYTARLQHRRQRDQKRRSEHTEVRQARLDRRRVRRAAEQPAARQTRLATDRQRTHERRAAEQPEASLVGKARKTG